MAADAAFFIRKDDPVLSLIKCSGRTGLYTGGIPAVLTGHRQELKLLIYPVPRLHFRHHRIARSCRKIVLQLAYRLAGAASHAAPGINI